MQATEAALPVSSTRDPVALTEDALQVRDGTRLHSYRWISDAAEQQSGAVVVIAHGYGEYGRRYDHFARYLVRRGHPTYCYDARGHGFSPGQRGHIDRYGRYVEDFTDVARQVAARHSHRPLFLLGHSNGGLTVLRAVQHGGTSAAGFIMTCPMLALQPRHAPLSRGAAAVAALLLSRLPMPNGIDHRELSHNSAINEAWDKDPMNHGRTTPRWYLSALDEMARGLADADKVTLPVLAFAADSDSIVDPHGVEQLVARLASADRELVVCKGAFHEVLNELDREQIYKRIGDWLAARGA